MTIWKHEMRQGRGAMFVWTAVIAFLVAVCVFLFPEMEGEMGEVGDMFSSMGSFTQAFGMDRLNFGEFLGFYGVECGNILGLGGAFFAALPAVMALSKEEWEHTAEFLLSHPISRRRIVTEKLCALASQIVFLNAVVFATAAVSVTAIGEEPDWEIFCLIHLAYFLLQFETAAVCFGISAFMRRKSFGVGLGAAALLYFLNMIANLAETAQFLKYITPFGYAEPADIIADKSLDGARLLVGLIISAICIAAAYGKYCRKDISA